MPARTGLAIGLQEKARLHAAMQRHVDRHTVGGVYPYLDTKTGEVRSLHPVTAHPMILKMGDKFVLCYDFLDEKRQKVEIDYYLAAKNDGYIVFHTAINNRRLLMRLMRAGKVARTD